MVRQYLLAGHWKHIISEQERHPQIYADAVCQLQILIDSVLRIDLE